MCHGTQRYPAQNLVCSASEGASRRTVQRREVGTWGRQGVGRNEASFVAHRMERRESLPGLRRRARCNLHDGPVRTVAVGTAGRTLVTRLFVVAVVARVLDTGRARGHVEQRVRRTRQLGRNEQRDQTQHRDQHDHRSRGSFVETRPRAPERRSTRALGLASEEKSARRECLVRHVLARTGTTMGAVRQRVKSRLFSARTCASCAHWSTRAEVVALCSLAACGGSLRVVRTLSGSGAASTPASGACPPRAWRRTTRGSTASH